VHYTVIYLTYIILTLWGSVGGAWEEKGELLGSALEQLWGVNFRGFEGPSTGSGTTSATGNHLSNRILVAFFT